MLTFSIFYPFIEFSVSNNVTNRLSQETGIMSIGVKHIFKVYIIDNKGVTGAMEKKSKFWCNVTCYSLLRIAI